MITVSRSRSTSSHSSGEGAAPADLLDSRLIRKLEALTFISRKLFAGQARGDRRTPRKGHSVEFKDYRHYEPGDDIRYLDWNVLGRLDRAFLKQFVDEQDVSIHILLDASGSMKFGSPQKMAYAKRVAAALAYVGLAGMERVALAVFTGGLHRGQGPFRGKAKIFEVLSFLHEVEPDGVTDFSGSLREYALTHKRPGIALIFSDLLDEKGIEPGIKHLLQGGHDVALIHILAPDELDPRLDGELRLIDAETGLSKEVVWDGTARRAYLRNLGRFLTQIEAFCRRMEVHYLQVATTMPVEDLIFKSMRRMFLK